MYILGIDPGSLHLGWAGLQLNEEGQLVGCQQGVLSAPAKKPFVYRLTYLSELMSQLLDQKKPDAAVIEKIFLGKNPDSAFKLGHIRGVCVVECQKRGANIIEYAAREVKKGITGSGGADKMTVRQILYAQLGISQDLDLREDASDALALAYCYYIRRQTEARFIKGVEESI